MSTAATDIPALDLPHGSRIPQLGLGTWQLEGGECERSVRAALDLGYRHIDTAEAYGNEDAIGRALEASPVDRDRLFLTSKVWYTHLREDDVRAACDASLRRLGTDYLDLYLIHWPNGDVPIAETVGALASLREEGKLRAWGVSNFTITHLEEALEHGRPATNQVELHPRLQQPGLDEFCAERGIVLTAYSPLARGEAPQNDALDAIGDRHGKDAAQVALRWSIQRGHVVIPKSSGEAHLQENMDLFDFELSDDEMARIAELDRGDRLVEPDHAEFDRSA